jgi:uncharacterized membrane protein YoaK (UPF0700 family)
MTWAAGFVDIVGYLALYGLYTAHMTGETVAMARHLSRLEWFGVIRRGWPIAMFVLGLLLGAFIFEAEKRRAIKVPFPATVGAEVVLIGVFVILGVANGCRLEVPPQPAAMFFLMIALLATAMGIQNVAIRRVGGINVYTTFVTGALVKFGEAVSEYLFWLRDRTRNRLATRFVMALRISPRQRSFQHAALTLGLWSAYLAGALSGTVATDAWASLSMLVPLTLLMAIVLYGIARPFLQLEQEDWQ